MPVFSPPSKIRLWPGSLFFVLFFTPLHAASVYQDAKAPLEDRVNDLFAQLTPEEKLSLLNGAGFTTQAIPRLGLPPIAMADAGQGVRGGREGTLGPATAFPAGVAMASSWDTDLVDRIGKAIGEEALNKGPGSQILLGPAVNIQRSPLGGRNGEYLTEDPYLAARLCVAYIQGMQSSGAVACIKHFACNNQEDHRGSIDVHVSERALREIYLPAFEAGVKEGHVDTLMASYNKINGHYATANKYLLTEVLKKGWGFDGLVMSDWGAVHEVGVVEDGTDLEMPGGKLSVGALQNALQDNVISQASVDDSVHRILRMILRTGLMDSPKTPDPALVNSPAHQKLAYEAAAKGIVLLKNEGSILPIDPAKIHTIAVIGQGSIKPMLGAQGSPHVTPPYFVTALQAITHRAATASINVISEPSAGVPIPVTALFQDANNTMPGLKAEYFNGDLTGKPVLVRTDNMIDFSARSGENPVPELQGDNYSIRWTGQIVAPETGTYYFNMNADFQVQVFIDDKSVFNNTGFAFFWGHDELPHTFSLDMTAGEAHTLRVEYGHRGDAAIARLNWITPSMSAFPEAAAAAKKADLAIVCVSTMATEGEAEDRSTMDLPFAQSALIRAVSAANKNVVVVLNNGTPVSMKEWLDQVPGLVETWLPGMEGGNALAAVLFGDVNPSGKLPTTLGVNREDYPDFGNFPGDVVENYAEDIFVGYRHFDKGKLAPAFPFGFGLSYTTFAYSNLKLGKTDIGPADKITATVDIKNTGSRAGEEVVELYIHDPDPPIEKAVRELKGFAKVALKPGETKTVSFELPLRALAYCDVPGQQWKADAGSYEVEVGRSSRDLKQTATLRLTSTYTEPIPFLGL